MLRNYFLIAVRNLSRHKLHTFINLLGLAIGLTCSILLYLYIQDELNYDRHFDKSDRIYRVMGNFTIQGDNDKLGSTSGLLAKVLAKSYPEIEKATRMAPVYSKSYLRHQASKQSFIEPSIYYGDPNFFEVFNYHFLAGNPKTALSKPYTMVVSKDLAEKFFGSVQEAIDKVLLHNQMNKGYRITAVVDKLPNNTTFTFEALLSTKTFKKGESFLDYWGNFACFTFVLLKENTSPETVNQKIKGLFAKNVETELTGFDISGNYYLQALTDVHLNSRNHGLDIDNRGDWYSIYIFSGVIILILIIASINYMNLATARSANRSREVGIRKVVGAYRQQLIFQFLVESILVTLIAFAISLTLVEIILPFFNQIVDKSLSTNYFDSSLFLPKLLLLVIVVGLLSGSYPALVLSGFRPILTLKGKVLNFGNKRNGGLRKFLVVLQFSISIIMIICTGIVISQMQFVNQKNLGFDKEQILIMEIEGETCHKANIIKEELKKIVNIKEVAGANASLGTKEYNVQGIFVESNEGDMKERIVNMFLADYDLLPLLNIPIVEGRNFSRKIMSDTSKAVLVNQAMVRKMNWKNAIGKNVVNLFDTETDDIEEAKKQPTAKVVGVFKNFHLLSLHQKIEPLVLNFARDKSNFYPNRIYIKINTQDIENTLKQIETLYHKFDKKRPFEAYFLDQLFAKQYKNDRQQLSIFIVFSIIAILIACLGLFGLTSFTIEQKTKEIGVRKVMGASLSQLIFMINKDFLKLVLLANILAFPIAFWIMSRWLESFAYRTEILDNWFTFLLSGLLAILIAMATVSSLAYRIIKLNPADVLKQE